MKYGIIATNDQGATTPAGIDWDHPNGGKRFPSLSAAIRAARRELGRGWRVTIFNSETGESVREFTVRKD